MGHGPSGKIKKSMIIGLLCEILYNFMSVLGFGWSKFPQSDVVAHPKNLNNSITGLFYEALNNLSTANFSGPPGLFFLAPPLCTCLDFFRIVWYILELINTRHVVCHEESRKNYLEHDIHV